MLHSIQSAIDNALQITAKTAGVNTTNINGSQITWKDIPISIQDNVREDKETTRLLIDLFGEARLSKTIIEKTEDQLKDKVKEAIDKERKALQKGEKDDIILSGDKYSVITSQRQRTSFDKSVAEKVIDGLKIASDKLTQTLANDILKKHKTTHKDDDVNASGIVDVLKQAIDKGTNLMLDKSVEVPASMIVDAISLLKEQQEKLSGAFSSTEYEMLSVKSL